MNRTRILLTGDWHTGHERGLASPIHIQNPIQKKVWKLFSDGIKQYAPFNVAVLNGDAIDGNGKRNGGVELITTDRNKQADMAINICKYISIENGFMPKWYFTFGTRYHVGDEEDFELQIARAFPNVNEGINYGRELKLVIDGVRFHIRHHIGSSSSPMARTNSLSREIVWRMLNENMDELEKVDVFVRSHVHYHVLTEQFNRVAMTLPALQLDSDYGQRRCTGRIDVGFVVMDIEDGKIARIIRHINPVSLKTETFIEV